MKYFFRAEKDNPRVQYSGVKSLGLNNPGVKYPGGNKSGGE